MISADRSRVCAYPAKANLPQYEAKDKYYIDTILLNETLMINLGLKKENIIDSGICSVCNSKYINSYRKDKANYKLSTAIININN